MIINVLVSGASGNDEIRGTGRRERDNVNGVLKTDEKRKNILDPVTYFFFFFPPPPPLSRLCSDNF